MLLAVPRNSHNLQNNLKQTRGKAGLTQGKLARHAGISRQAYSSLESGNANPSTAVALRLARALGERVELLFYLPDQPSETLEAELVGDSAAGSLLGELAIRARVFRVGPRLLARALTGPDNTRHSPFMLFIGTINIKKF